MDQCRNKLAHFKQKYEEDSPVTYEKLEDAQSTIDNVERCSISFRNLEEDLDKLRDLECATWLGTDEELDGLLNKLGNTDLSIYFRVRHFL